MLFNSTITDYNKFKEIFGTRANGGRIINKILLSFWIYRHKIDKDWRATQIKDLNSLYNLVITELSSHHPQECYYDPSWKLQFPKYTLYYRSSEYAHPRVCLADPRLVEYTNSEGKKATAKAGKFFRKLLELYKVRLDESTITYCSEVFQQDWETKSKEFTNLTLHIDDHFDRIYSSEYLNGGFNSCMVDKKHYPFYNKSVKAKAAYLTNAEDKIVARCILFTEVHLKDSDKVYRYAERQYSEDPIYKEILINSLISANAIDIYKISGAGCSDIKLIADLSGKTIEKNNLWITCTAKKNDVISYMDTFRFYNSDTGIASNYNDGDSNINLATTAMHF